MNDPAQPHLGVEPCTVLPSDVHASGRPLEAQLANMECNATSAVQITHHFLGKLVCVMPALERHAHQKSCRETILRRELKPRSKPCSLGFAFRR